MTISVSVRNFGPIAEGFIELMPFTVFIGPNNTGKSFLSTLIYAAEINTRRGPASIAGRIQPPSRGMYLSRSAVERTRRDLRRQLERPDINLRKVFSTMPPSAQNRLRELVRADLATYAISVGAELERCLGGKIVDLVRVARPPGEPMELSVRDSQVNWTVGIGFDNDDVVNRVIRMPPQRILLEQADKIALEAISRYFPVEVVQKEEGEDEGRLTVAGLPSPSLVSHFPPQIASLVASNMAEELHEYLFSNFPISRHYLPAARSGIMQSHKSLAAFLVRSAPLVGLQQMAVPQLSGIVTDFISQLLNLDVRRTKRDPALAAIANNLETAVLHGKIEVRAEPDTYPEILYRVGKLTAPLVRLSSMISELAPVVLYIRYVLTKGQHLIIEEPEAHLHPESQRDFARALANLSNYGIDVTMTTHSDYLLTEINNLIRENTVAKVTQTEAPQPSIPAGRVAAYLFENHPTEIGTTIRRLKVTEDEGIPDEEFGRVAEAIYHKAADLQYRLIESNGPR